MRARLHDPGPAAADEDSDDDFDPDLDAEAGSDLDPATGALLVPPGRFLAEDSIPAYPSPDETEDELRADPDAEFSVERHRERHIEAVEKWREAVADAIADSATLRLDEGTRQVEVKALGESFEE